MIQLINCAIPDNSTLEYLDAAAIACIRCRDGAFANSILVKLLSAYRLVAGVTDIVPRSHQHIFEMLK